MQRAEKHIFINTKNLQESIFFRTFKYFLAQHSTAQHSTAQHSTAQHSTAQHSTAQHSTAQHSTAQHSTAQHSTAQHSTAQHSLNQLIFSLLLFCCLFSFAQEENSTSFYINPNTTIVGVDYINLKLNAKLVKQEKEQTHLYIVENTIFFSSQDLATVTIKGYDESQKLSENKKYKVSKDDFLVKTNEQVVKVQSKTQVTQTPFPFSIPNEQKQTIVSAVSIITVNSSTFSKTISKAFTVDNGFLLLIRKVSSKKQNTVCYNKNGKPFQVKTKHCNRPPPVFYC